MVKVKQEQNNISPNANNIVIDDDLLVNQARAGNMASIERLILLYQDRVYNSVLKICGNRDDAAELTQDAFVKALQGLKNFRSDSSFYTWLFRIAVNNTLSFCRKNKKLKFESIDARFGPEGRKQLADFLADSASPDPAKIAIGEEIAVIVHRGLEQLEPAQRAVVVLRDIEQMSYAEIAETLDIELGTVKSRIARGRESLRQILEAVLE
ncbi:MAG: sigma-70 family RNA polymerase sigma factor [Anaerohalosphaeraceae bacterium]|nr:sigma-70 family RNA polymerase sigma factor [Anaerohalosphaeraceae bacterium]